MRVTRRDVLLGGAAGVGLAALGLPAPATAQDGGEGARLRAFFAEVGDAAIRRHPQLETSLGRRYDRGEWDDESDAFDEREEAIEAAEVARLQASFDPAKLSHADRLSYRLFLFRAEQNRELFRWRFHRYPLNHLDGLHTGAPAFLINQHRIRNVADANAYVARLATLPQRFAVLEETVRRRADMGILPPRFSLVKVRGDAATVVAGAPMDGSDRPTTLFADLTAKLDRAEIPAAERQAILDAGRTALREAVKPAYDRLIAFAAAMEARAGTDDGVWRLPDGAAFYQACIRQHTTLDLTADAVHEFGLSEVKRLQAEIDGIRRAVGFQGDLRAFFLFMGSDPRFFFTDDDAGREQYLALARAAIQGMSAKLGEVFRTLPKAAVEVRRVEPFRERTAPPAFYNRPSTDGSRPGIYFINLMTMRERPRWEIEAIAYHEAVPGHHMQAAIIQESKDLPLFRQIGGYTVHAEGWGLYTEQLAREMGFYADPYADFGRLNLELWRAIRLVVDTGMHARRWSREQAIDYMMGNMVTARENAVREIERYIIWPGQALSYLIGKRAILDLRTEAKTRMGDRFDIKQFHEMLLVDGSLPLPILRDEMRAWMEGRRTI